LWVMSALARLISPAQFTPEAVAGQRHIEAVELRQPRSTFEARRIRSGTAGRLGRSAFSAEQKELFHPRLSNRNSSIHQETEYGTSLFPFRL
jgi:hypothetical protein